MPTSTVPAARRQVRKTYPALSPDVHVLFLPIAPNQFDHAGIPGRVIINGTDYDLDVLADVCDHRTTVLGYRLTNHTSNKVYDLPHDISACDCPDAIFRQRVDGCCKHRKALAEMRTAGQLPS